MPNARKYHLILTACLLILNCVASVLLMLIIQRLKPEIRATHQTTWQLSPTLAPTFTPPPTAISTNTPLPTQPPPSATPLAILYTCGYDRCQDSGEYGQLTFEHINVWNNHDPERGGINRKLEHQEQIIIIKKLRVDEGPGGLWYQLEGGGWINDLWVSPFPCTAENLDRLAFGNCLTGKYETNTPSPPTATSTPMAMPQSPTVAPSPCLCTSNLYNCDDFATQSQAQACYQHCLNLGAGDIHRLDQDNNGLACEGLP